MTRVWSGLPLFNSEHCIELDPSPANLCDDNLMSSNTFKVEISQRVFPRMQISAVLEMAVKWRNGGWRQLLK